MASINPEKAAHIRAGRAPVLEPRLDELIRANVRAGRLAAFDRPDAAADAEVYMICVGTPSNAHGAVDLTALDAVLGQIARMLAGTRVFKTVVIRSTLPPDIIPRSVIPALASSGLQPGVDVGLCINPEFLREGSAVDDFFQAPFTLIGQFNDASGDAVAPVYTGLDAPIFRTDIATASLVKYASQCVSCAESHVRQRDRDARRSVRR